MPHPLAARWAAYIHDGWVEVHGGSRESDVRYDAFGIPRSGWHVEECAHLVAVARSKYTTGEVTKAHAACSAPALHPQPDQRTAKDNAMLHAGCRS